jgi:hypothetical protein
MSSDYYPNPNKNGSQSRKLPSNEGRKRYFPEPENICILIIYTNWYLLIFTNLEIKNFKFDK